MANQDFLIRIEGVNFDATIGDTNDLSTMRGGSLALLALGDAVSAIVPDAVLVTSGASQALHRVRRDGTPTAIAAEIRSAIGARFAGGARATVAEIAGDTPPFSQLTVVVDAVPDGREAHDHLEAMNHARQLRQWTVVPLAFEKRSGTRADPFDGVRPAREPVYLPPGKVLSLDESSDGGKTKAELSTSVASRRAYGRRERQLFYRRELKDDWAEILQAVPGTDLKRKAAWSFVNSIEDMVYDPPAGVPTSLRSKVAVVYADGNSFGDHRKKMGAEAFGKELAPLRNNLLSRIIRWFVENDTQKERSPFAVRDAGSGTRGLRFETLLWGGDEVMFVMPAWLAVDFVAGFLDVTRTWKTPQGPLTHALGVAIAHHKTPIRQLQTIARAAADLAKDADLRSVNSVTFDIFESLAPPDTSLGAARARVFLTPDDRKGQTALARSLALTETSFSEVVEAIGRAKIAEDDGIARSQLYAALRKVRALSDPEGYFGSAAGTAVREHLEEYGRRISKSGRELEASIPVFGDRASARALAFDVAMTTALWDYVRPLAAPLPSFPLARA